MRRTPAPKPESTLQTVIECYRGTAAFLVGLGLTALIVGARGARLWATLAQFRYRA